MRWRGSSLGIVVILITVILAVATVVVGTRRVPGAVSPRAAGAGAEDLESYLASVDRWELLSPGRGSRLHTSKDLDA